MRYEVAFPLLGIKTYKEVEASDRKDAVTKGLEVHGINTTGVPFIFFVAAASVRKLEWSKPKGSRKWK